MLVRARNRQKRKGYEQRTVFKTCAVCHKFLWSQKMTHCLDCYRVRRCPVCGGVKPPSRTWCEDCVADHAVRVRILPRERRPEGWAFPPGHIERLAARAAMRLPLFG